MKKNKMYKQREVSFNTYVNIPSFIINEFGLVGDELLIYSIIYGFCQDSESEFHGSISYLEKRTGRCRNRVLEAIKYLIEDEFIFETITGTYNQTTNHYKINFNKFKNVPNNHKSNNKTQTSSNWEHNILKNNIYNISEPISNISLSDIPTLEDVLFYEDRPGNNLLTFCLQESRQFQPALYMFYTQWNHRNLKQSPCILLNLCLCQFIHLNS